MKITKETAAWVLWYYGEGGYEPGGFTGQLMKAISRADEWNLHLLSKGFPELVHAMKLAMRDPDGLDTMKRILASPDNGEEG